MPQRTFDDGFYHASRARDIAVGNGSANTNVLTEINILQESIDAAARAGKLNLDTEKGVDGTGTTPVVTVMTTIDDYGGSVPGASSHYDAWFDLDQSIKLQPDEESTLKRAQVEMDRVIAYFTRLGYSIRREQQDAGGNVLRWIINW